MVQVAQPPAVHEAPALPSADRLTAEAAGRWLALGDAPALPPVAALPLRYRPWRHRQSSARGDATGVEPPGLDNSTGNSTGT